MAVILKALGLLCFVAITAYWYWVSTLWGCLVSSGENWGAIIGCGLLFYLAFAAGIGVTILLGVFGIMMLLED